MPFPFCELSYDLQRLVACAVLDPRDRAALCLAQPRLGLQLTDKATGVAPYTDFIFRVGMELQLTGAPVDETFLRRYARDHRAVYDGAMWLNGHAEMGMGLVIKPRTGHSHLQQWTCRVDKCKVRVAFPGGVIKHYEGEAGAEHKVRVVFPSGQIHHFEGEKGAERRVRVVYPSGRIDYFEGEKGAEHKVRVGVGIVRTVHFA